MEGINVICCGASFGSMNNFRGDCGDDSRNNRDDSVG